MTLRRAAWWTGGLCALAAALAAGALFTPLARVTEFAVDGEQLVAERLIARAAEAGADGTLFGRQYRLPSLFAYDPAAARAAVLEAFPELSEAVVLREWPHGVRIMVTERTKSGVWCRGESCRYWDRSGARWGTAVPSVGPLMLLVTDERSDESVAPRFLEGMLAAVDNLPALGLGVRRVILPDAEPGGIRIELVQGYELRMDALGDIADQLATLQVFLGEKARTGGFAPAYLDLRTPGRVYFR